MKRQLSAKLSLSVFTLCFVLVSSCGSKSSKTKSPGHEQELSGLPGPVEPSGILVEGQYPNCGNNYKKFDERCCEQGKGKLRDEIQELKEQGYELSQSSYLLWRPYSKTCHLEETSTFLIPVNCSEFKDRTSCCTVSLGSTCRWITRAGFCGENRWSSRTGRFGIPQSFRRFCNRLDLDASG